jgi:hypothetical protein
MAQTQEQVTPELPAITSVVEALKSAASDLVTVAASQVNGVNTEDLARQVDAEYIRVAEHIGNLAGHILDLHTNPRPAPEDYSVKS